MDNSFKLPVACRCHITGDKYPHYGEQLQAACGLPLSHHRGQVSSLWITASSWMWPKAVTYHYQRGQAFPLPISYNSSKLMVACSSHNTGENKGYYRIEIEQLRASTWPAAVALQGTIGLLWIRKNNSSKLQVACCCHSKVTAVKSQVASRAFRD